jgi:hypothetical protein
MIKRSGLFVLGLVAIGFTVTPVMGQNLLTNGDFEAGAAITGWTKWSGAQAPTDNKVTGASDNFIFGPDPHVYGSYSYKVGQWNSSPCDGGIYQQVAVTPGQAYTLQFKWAGGDWGTKGDPPAFVYSAWHEIGVTDAAVANGTSGHIAYSRKDNVAGWGWELVQLSFTPTQSTITVYIRTGRNTPNAWDPIATWVDDVVLSQVPPISLVSMNPIHARGNDTNATIVGANLTGATAVKLVQGATVVNGTNVVIAPDGNSLTVSFATAAAPHGAYDLVVEKTGLSPATLLSVFRCLDPAATILTNGDFETGNLNGWTLWNAGWGSIQTAVANNGDIWIPVGGPVGAGLWSLYQHTSGTGESGVVQSVRVVPGEILQLSWLWGGGDGSSGGNNSTHNIGILRNQQTSGTSTEGDRYHDVGQVSIVDANAIYGWDAGSFLFEVPAGVNWITVDAWSWQQAATTYASYWDDVSLVTATLPANQHTVTGFSPTEVDNRTSQFDLTITGTNLDQVTQAVLDLAGNWVVAQSVTSSGGGTSLTAHFEAPSDYFPVGAAQLLTMQPDAARRTKSGFTFTQRVSQITGIDVTSARKWDGVVHMTVTGQNLDILDSIQLYQPVPGATPKSTQPGLGDMPMYTLPDMPAATRTIAGTFVNKTNPNSITVDFDVDQNNAAISEGGVYKYQVVGHRVDVPEDIVLDDAFELLPPDSSLISSVLKNGDFELDSTDWLNLPYTDLTTVAYGMLPSGAWDANSHSGSHFAGRISGGNTVDDTFEQDIGLFAGPGQYDLIVTCWVAMTHHNNSTVTVSLVGDENEPTHPEQSVVVVADPDWPWSPDPGWVKVNLDFSANLATSLKLRFGFHTEAHDYGANGAWGKTQVDDVVLYSKTSSCHDPFADADGDADVDQSDFAVFQACFTGSGATVADACRCLDWNSDTHIDQLDLVAFENCASGPGITASKDPCPGN